MNYYIVAILVILFLGVVFAVIVLIDSIRAENEGYAKKKAELEHRKELWNKYFECKTIEEKYDFITKHCSKEDLEALVNDWNKIMSYLNNSINNLAKEFENMGIKV